MRVQRKALIKSPALLLVALIVSCAAPSSQSPETHLLISFKPDGANIASEYILDCSGDLVLDTSTLPADADVCSQLNEQAAAFTASLNPATPCTEIYGGPQRVQITGTFKRQPFDSEFSRTNGCLINQWERVSFLLDSGF
ncbi:hypothetical protein [Glutamicibacter sp. JC586]|uniref:hypothetical protein n=1 Tax=Glutamicibacter sp. JC586 TaxID=2590552 RepID=UPI00135AE38D|nr:hypothetical protein [Glutamicibacter sp. JC586]